MAGLTDSHILLTTKEMEENKKSIILTETFGLAKERYKVLIIDANNPTLILQTLTNFDWQANNHYVVNITGGNKMMSQMAFIHFSRKYDSSIYYWPIGTSFLEKLHPAIQEIEVLRPCQLDLKTYIAAHGYTYTCNTTLSYPISKAQKLSLDVIHLGSTEYVLEIRNAKANEYNKSDKNYYLGRWLEEWLYIFLKKSLKIPESQIAFNLKLKSWHSVRNTESDNEIDVEFVINNRLYIWEC